MAKLATLMKNKDISLKTKLQMVTSFVFPVAMYGCESWTIKKQERKRIDAFELWCWRRVLRIPWTARQTNKSVIETIKPKLSLEAMIIKQQLSYFGQ